MSIDAQHLAFSYTAHRQVLKDVNFHIDDGKMVCLLGANGIGKSTLFKTILRILPNYKGEIWINGRSTNEMSISDMAKLIAYIPQSYPPTFNYSVLDMVLMGTTAGLSFFGSPGKRQREVALQSMERLGIEHLKDRGFAEISGGERQLALIARALAQETKVLLMDEPTANLDYGNATMVLEQIRQLAGKGYTILQATHQPDQAFLFADEVLSLKDGVILAHGTPKETITEEFIETLYGVHVEIQSLYNDKLRVCVPVTAIRSERNWYGEPVEKRKEILP